MQICLVLTLAMAGVASAQTAAAPTQTRAATLASELQRVVIQVNDPSGAPVPGAFVRVAPAPEPKPENMQTDNKGQLTLEFKPGRYSMVVTMQGFSMNKSQLDVTGSEGRRTVLVTLEVGRGGGVLLQSTPDPNVIMLTVAPFTEKFRITHDDLNGLPRKSVVAHNPHSNADEKYEGVLLAELLGKYGAPLGKELRGGFLSYYVLAVGADGYSAVYSLAEVDPSFHPGDVIIADTMDGKPLDAHAGPFRLVCTEDKRPARGVRNLVAIEVKAAP